MSKELKKYTVTILGEPFSLVTDEPEEHVLQAAKKADLILQEIKGQATSIDTQKVAILGLLQLASNSIHLEAKLASNGRIHENLIDLIDQELSCETAD